MNVLALAGSLQTRPGAVRRFLTAAIDRDAPDIEALCAAGVARYDAQDFIRRLEQHGELRDGRWCDEARAGYRSLLTPPRVDRLDRRASDDMPREKVHRSGVERLSDEELLALLLRTGSTREGVMELAARLIDDHDGLLGLASANMEELMGSVGMGPAKSAEIAAAFELARRVAQAKRRRRPVLRDPESVVAFLRDDAVHLRHEEFWCLPLDVHARLIGAPQAVSRGDVDGTEAGPRLFFRHALRHGAVSAIAVHNHPSGEARPSESDRAVTRRLARAGRIIDVSLADHIIIGEAGNYTSLRRHYAALFMED